MKQEIVILVGICALSAARLGYESMKSPTSSAGSNELVSAAPSKNPASVTATNATVTSDSATDPPVADIELARHERKPVHYCGDQAATYHDVTVLSTAKRRCILDPEGGSALARARNFGIDLTLILLAVERTPQERLERAIQAQSMVSTMNDLCRGMRRA